jgi:hypothetical protein
MERLRHQALHFVLADPGYEPAVDGPLLKNVNCVGSLGDMPFSPEVAARPTEGFEIFDCPFVGEGHGSSGM